MKSKKSLVLILLVVFVLLIVGCGQNENGSDSFQENFDDSVISSSGVANTDENSSDFADSNANDNAKLDEQRKSAIQEIENYINEISSSLSDDGKEYVEYVKSIYVPAIEERTDEIDKLKQICLLKMEQAFIRDTQDFEIEKLNEEYNPAIDNVCSWLDGLLEAGIYRNSEEEYNLEIKDLDNQLRDIATDKTKKKNYYAQMCAWNGYSQSWLQTRYSEVDSEYEASYNYLVSQKEYIQALWENREKYDEYLVLLGGLEEERDALIAEINEEYDLKYQELGQQISELEK